MTYSLSRDVRFIQVVGSCILMGWLFFGVIKKFHCIQINQDLSSCSVNYYTYRMQYLSLAHCWNMEVVLLVALTNHRSARLTVALIRYRSARKYPFIL